MKPVPVLRAIVAAVLGLALVALTRRAWIAVGEIEQALAEAETDLAHRD